MVAGLPSDAVSQTLGMPFSFSTSSSDIARTSDDTPIIVSIKNETQAMTRAMAQMRCFRSFCLYFFIGMVYPI